MKRKLTAFHDSIFHTMANTYKKKLSNSVISATIKCLFCFMRASSQQRACAYVYTTWQRFYYYCYYYFVICNILCYMALFRFLVLCYMHFETRETRAKSKYLINSTSKCLNMTFNDVDQFAKNRKKQTQHRCECWRQHL